MTSSGPNNGSSFTNSGAGGSWVNPTNAATSNNAWAQVDLPAGTASKILIAKTYGFAIPADATINGVLVEIEKSGSSDGDGFGIVDSSVRLLSAAGSPTGSNYAKADYWSGGDTYVSYGGAADMWGCALTVAWVNDVDFGVSIRAGNPDSPDQQTAYIDHIRITVYYTEAAASYSQTISIL